MYGGDRGSRAACRQKSVMFFVRFFVFFCFFLSRFAITKFVITEAVKFSKQLWYRCIEKGF